jgi:flavin-binding protein dodecin
MFDTADNTGVNFHPDQLDNKESGMSVAKIIEIISSSKTGFDDALSKGVARASDSLHDITGAWVKDQSVVVTKGKITEYRVTMKVTFVLKPTTAKRKK